MMNGDGYVTYEERGDAMVVRIGGEIDHHGAVAVRSGIDRVLATRRPPRVYLELSGVSFMDSSGIGLIMGRCRLMDEHGGSVRVTGASGQLKKVLRLSGIDRIAAVETLRHKEERYETTE